MCPYRGARHALETVQHFLGRDGQTGKVHCSPILQIGRLNARRMHEISCHQLRRGDPDACVEWHRADRVDARKRLTEDAAFDRAWRWYGGAPPTDEETAAIDEWIDRVIKPPKRKKKAA